ncbi:SH2 domain-containing protein 2A [Tupaia chinensis]|uniref:SH2 domain-containing protein 2A n=1 Tax=Tupaia chinensis TaxID=246437 RepID=L9KES9_TUPCH|nr:SH2 domain-containing protein 2A [Tupaia chinensis]
MELPLAQTCPQESHEAPAPTFSTFRPTGVAHKSCQGPDLLPLPGLRPQAPKAEEVQPNPRVPAVHAVVSPQAPAAASSPENAGRAEEVPGEGGLSLQAEIWEWFQKTQAHQLLQHGAAPAWFHGFITRRRGSDDQPPSRSLTCCRHFLLAQLRDGRHVVLGEDSAHARLQDLLRHYTECPLSPYRETLTEPLARQTAEPAGLSLKFEEPDSGCRSQDPNPQYTPVIKPGQTPAPGQKEGARESKEPAPPTLPNPLPAKPQLPAEVYTSPAPRPRPGPPPEPTTPIYHELDEPIAFYAMGRGSPGEGPSNIYAEVEGPPAPERPPESPPTSLAHLILRKCRSRPVSGGQGVQGKVKHNKGLALAPEHPGAILPPSVPS